MIRRKNLEAACHAKRLTQAELAEELAVSTDIVSRWIRAKVNPTRASKARLEEFFEGYDIEELLKVFDDGEDHPPEDTPTATLWLPPSSSVQKFIANSMVRRFWQIAHTDYSPDEMTHAVAAAMKESDMKNTGDPTYTLTRRDALCELASIPLIALGQKHALPDPRRYEEMLRFCVAALEGCWELYRGSDPVGARHAFEHTSIYVPMLETIARDSSQFRKEALELAAQYALLQTLLGWSVIGAKETIDIASHALLLSKESGNILLQISAYPKVSWTHTQGCNYTEAHDTMQEGEYALKEYQRTGKGPALPTGVIGNFYSGYSLAQIDNGINADTAFGIATDSEPLKGQIALVKFTTTDQQWEAARICNAKGDPKQAIQWLEKLIDLETLNPRLDDLRVSRRGWVGAINTLTDALLQSEKRDMGQIIHVWTTAIKGAKALKSEQRYRDAMANFAVMRTLWRSEQTIRSLMSLTSHW